MRALSLAVFLITFAAQAETTARHPAAAKPSLAPEREYSNPDFHNPAAAGVPVTVESASEPIDITIFWNAPEAQGGRAVSSENP